MGLFIAAAVILLDQGSKALLLAQAQLVDFPVRICTFFNLVLVHNTGVSFGMFAHQQAWMPLLLTAATCLIVLMLLIWFFRANDKATLYALAFILGGALGNIIDRVRYGAVTDFFDFHVGSYHWPAFNVADSAIFIGVVILVLISIVRRESTEL